MWGGGGGGGCDTSTNGLGGLGVCVGGGGDLRPPSPLIHVYM